ncbi:MAG: toprim domain-containing protein, partial [Clostridia bacterium]|nr:toprim domain-containing protein [Clostridia bacterium]
NVVASMGTSLTQDQARLLKRYTDNVLISYDGDSAGQKANMRGLDVLKSNGLNVKVVPLTDGLDPDDMIKQRGAEAYQKCLDSALPLIDYKLKSTARGFDLSKSDDKRRYVSEAVKIIKTADSASEQEDLLKSLRDTTGITYESLKRDLNSAPAVQQTVQKPKERKDNSSMQDRASRFVISAFLFGSKITDGEDISKIRFLNGVHEIIAKYIFSKKFLDERVQPSELFEFFDENTEEYEELTRILDYSDGNALKGEVAEKYFHDCVKTLKLAEIDENVAKVKAQINTTEDVAKRKDLAIKLQSLINQKEKIKSGEKK